MATTSVNKANLQIVEFSLEIVFLLLTIEVALHFCKMKCAL